MALAGRPAMLRVRVVAERVGTRCPGDAARLGRVLRGRGCPVFLHLRCGRAAAWTLCLDSKSNGRD